LHESYLGKWSGGQISWDLNSLFHEVKIPNNWFNLLIAAFFTRSKLSNNAFLGFDLMIVLVTNKSIMRSKFKKALLAVLISWKTPRFKIQNSKFKINYLNLVSCTCGKFLTLIISHLCIGTFDLMIALAANKSIMRSKFPNNALFWVLISW
jgi:hypothetical protein